jgi:hypothetical protein
MRKGSVLSLKAMLLMLKDIELLQKVMLLMLKDTIQWHLAIINTPKENEMF